MQVLLAVNVLGVIDSPKALPWDCMNVGHLIAGTRRLPSTGKIFPRRTTLVLCSPLRCSRKKHKSGLISQLELGKLEAYKQRSQINGIFWLLLLNIGIYMADHLLQIGHIHDLYLNHSSPSWYQFITSTFCHTSWDHISSNLFFLYMFGKLIEEEEGIFALWISYILTGAAANLVSWLVLPRNTVSVGASGAVFGLFSISVLVKVRWDWRKILEVLILGQFVIQKVMEAVGASTTQHSVGGYSVQHINHIAHLSGAIAGATLVWILSAFPDSDKSPLVKNKKDC